MEVIKLKNGTEECKPLVAIVMGILNHLADERPLALYDLAMRCRDQNYQFFGDNEEYLQQLKLIDANGVIHDSDRNVILSAMRGDGFDITLGSPVAKST